MIIPRPKWRPDRDQVLIGFHAQCLFYRDIAERMGTTEKAIEARCFRLGLDRRRVIRGPRSTPDFQWNDGCVETLRSMWPTNSAAVIAAVLGPAVTRNSVIGKARRLGLEHKSKSCPHRSPAAPQERRAPKIRPASRFSYMNDMEPQDLPLDQSPFAVSLFDIKPHKCRWPLNATSPVSDFLFCGAPSYDDKQSYCGRHCRAAYSVRL